MSENLNFKTIPLAMELIPVAVQIAGIFVFLLIAREEPIYTFAAIILSLIWLKVSHSEMPQQFGEKRAARYLFGKLGGWMDREDAEDVFDEAQSTYLMIDESVEADQYRAVVTLTLSHRLWRCEKQRLCRYGS